MEEWKNGKVEEWKSGKMEWWKNARLDGRTEKKWKNN